MGFPFSMCDVVTPTQLVLDVHKQRAHGINDGRIAKSSTHLVALTGVHAPDLEVSQQDKLDATNGWSGSFRDHGQFGSHPSFDASDDGAE